MTTATETLDYTLLSQNSILDCFNKYKLWLAKYICKQGVDFEDAQQEAYIVFAETLKKVDLQKVTNPKTWSLHVFLRQKLASRAKTVSKSLQAIVMASETYEDVVADPQRSFVDIITTNAVFADLVSRIPKRFKTVKTQQIVTLLVQGMPQIDIARSLGCSRQYINLLIINNRDFFEKALRG